MALFGPRGSACGTPRTGTVGGRGVPGVWDDWGGWEGYTGTTPSTIPGPIFSHIPEVRASYGQMKAILEVFMRFPE